MVYDTRLERERDFHNERFGGPEERKQDSFYNFAARTAINAYWRRVDSAAKGKEVLEYGCADGRSSIRLAGTVKRITGIDLSDVAIQQANEEASRRCLDNVTFQVDNAEDMSLPDASFDLVFGSGILHHLILEKAVSEICRVLRPGGKAIFFEPLGHNPMINLYRSRTPEARTIDEHPLLKSDLDIVRRHFSKSELEFFSLTTLAAIPFRGSRFGASIRTAGEKVDRLLLKLPGLRWQAWIAVMDLEK